MSKSKNPDKIEKLTEEFNEPNLSDYEVVLQFQKGIIEKKETFNQFNLLVRPGRFFNDELLREMLPDDSVLQLRLEQAHANWWTLKFNKFHSVKKIGGILIKFLEENKLRFIKE